MGRALQCHCAKLCASGLRPVHHRRGPRMLGRWGDPRWPMLYTRSLEAHIPCALVTLVHLSVMALTFPNASPPGTAHQPPRAHAAREQRGVRQTRRAHAAHEQRGARRWRAGMWIAFAFWRREGPPGRPCGNRIGCRVPLQLCGHYGSDGAGALSRRRAAGWRAFGWTACRSLSHVLGPRASARAAAVLRAGSCGRSGSRPVHRGFGHGCAPDHKKESGREVAVVGTQDARRACLTVAHSANCAIHDAT